MTENFFQLNIDPSKCTGCRLCTLACAMKNHGWLNPRLTRIKIITLKNPSLNVPVVCLACDDAPCLKVCPVNARLREPNGSVVTDENRCIGCRACVYICPVGSPTINPFTGQTMTCDLCHGDPAGPWCVTACRHEGALNVVTTETLPTSMARGQATRFRSARHRAGRD